MPNHALARDGACIGATCPSSVSPGHGKYPEENVVIRAILFQLPAFKTNEDLVRLVHEAGVKNINPECLIIIKHEVFAYPKKGTEPDAQERHAG